VTSNFSLNFSRCRTDSKYFLLLLIAGSRCSSQNSSITFRLITIFMVPYKLKTPLLFNGRDAKREGQWCLTEHQGFHFFSKIILLLFDFLVAGGKYNNKYDLKLDNQTWTKMLGKIYCTFCNTIYSISAAAGLYDVSTYHLTLRVTGMPTLTSCQNGYNKHYENWLCSYRIRMHGHNLSQSFSCSRWSDSSLR